MRMCYYALYKYIGFSVVVYDPEVIFYGGVDIMFPDDHKTAVIEETKIANSLTNDLNSLHLSIALKVLKSCGVTYQPYLTICMVGKGFMAKPLRNASTSFHNLAWNYFTPQH